MVYAVVQDHQGYMWFGTTGGLGRYDGVGFTVFRHDVADPDSLTNNQIYTLYVDRRGRLWAGGVAGGLSRYEPDTGGFAHWLHDPADRSSLSHDEVWSIAQTPDGTVVGGDPAGPGSDARRRPRFRPREDTTLPRGCGRARDRARRARCWPRTTARLWIGSERGIYLRRRRWHAATGAGGEPASRAT